MVVCVCSKVYVCACVYSFASPPRLRRLQLRARKKQEYWKEELQQASERVCGQADPARIHFGTCSDKAVEGACAVGEFHTWYSHDLRHGGVEITQRRAVIKIQVAPGFE